MTTNETTEGINPATMPALNDKGLELARARDLWASAQGNLETAERLRVGGASAGAQFPSIMSAVSALSTLQGRGLLQDGEEFVENLEAYRMALANQAKS